MRISSFISFLGFVLIIAGSYSPLLRPFHLFNYNLYDLSKPYGIVVLLMAVVGILGVVLRQRGLARTMAIISLLLVGLIFAAAVFKVDTSFSFIPLKGLATALSHSIKFKWGWYLLFGGSIMTIWGTFADRPARIKAKPVEI